MNECNEPFESTLTTVTKPTLFQFYDDLPASDRVIVQFSPISSRSIVVGGWWVLIPLGVELCCASKQSSMQQSKSEARREKERASLTNDVSRAKTVTDS